MAEDGKLLSEEEMSAIGEGLNLMKDLTMEKLTLGYGGQESFLWLAKHGSLEGRLEALTFLNEREDTVLQALKKMKRTRSPLRRKPTCRKAWTTAGLRTTTPSRTSRKKTG